MVLTSGFVIYKRLLRHVRVYWWAFLCGLLGTILAAGADASFTWFLKPVLDRGFTARDEHFIRWLPWIILCAFLLRGFANVFANYYMSWAARSVVMQFRQAIFQHLLKLPANFYDHTTSGQLLSTIIYNVEQVAKASTDALVTIVQESCFVVGLLIVMLLNSWQLTLLFLITVPLIAAVARYSSRRMRRLSHHVQQSMGLTTHIAEEAIEGYKVIRLFGGQAYEQNKFDRVSKDNRTRELKMVVTSGLNTAVVQQIAGIAVTFTIYLATAHYTHITAGGFASMLAAMLAILKPMKNLSSVSATMQKGIAGAESIFKLLDQPLEQDEGTRKLARARGHIVYEQINFAYKEHQPILQDINFTIEPGQTIAIVGRSGSGKSTLVNLLPRFYSNYTGKIYIDGIDTQTIRLTDLRNQFALVSQQVTLFNDTISNNIAYGSECSLKEIREAAKVAHALEFIENLPHGLDSLVGENGVLLSGGQRQRLAIARALLKNAPILILDEATSALDTESERHIQEALATLMKERTTLVIAHRLSTIENADQILVLDAGKIVEVGKHKELVAAGGYYAKLYRMQFGNYSD